MSKHFIRVIPDCVLLNLVLIFFLFRPIYGKQLSSTISILQNNLFSSVTDGKLKDLYFYPARNILTTIDSQYGSEAGHFISDKLFSFSYNQKNESCEELKYIGDCMLSCLNRCSCNYLPPKIKKHLDDWTDELAHFPFEYPSKMPETFHFHHGMRFQPQALKNYLKNRDIIDVGAYIGDSALALSNYTNKRIFSYEISNKFVEDGLKLLKDFNLAHKVNLTLKGMSDVSGKMRINDHVDLGQNLEHSKAKEGSGYEIDVVTIDDEVRTHKLKVGFIKADVEGLGLKVLSGGIKTIKRDRPIIELASYHCFDEMFGFPEFISQFPNYLLEFHSESGNMYSLHEFAIFAYPAEILYPIYKDFLYI